MSPELLGWLKHQHPWLQSAAGRLRANGTVSEEDVRDFVRLIKEPSDAAECGQQYLEAAPESVASGEVCLISIGPVEGIDALKPREPLSFGSTQLCVIYGNNGSGKSGYTRVISKMCGKSHVGDLQGNVFAAPPPQQMCTIRYRVGDEVAEADWTPGTQVDALVSVDIFDTASGAFYLENETEISFVPPDLALLADLVRVCSRVAQTLEAEVRALVSTLPALPPEHAGTRAASGYSALTHKFTEVQLAELSAWTEADNLELEAANATLANADPNATAQKRLAVNAQREAILAALEAAIASLSNGGLEISRTRFADAANKRRIAREAAQALDATCTVEGVGSDTWRRMWRAAREFALEEAYPSRAFPVVDADARCVLCQQELDQPARDRLAAFEAAVSGKIETEAAAAEQTLTEHVNSLPIRPTAEALQTAAQAAELESGLAAALDEAWNEVDSLLQSLRSGVCPESPFVASERTQTLIRELQRLGSLAEQEAAALKASADPAARRETELRRKELLARKWISEQREALVAEVERLKRVHIYYEWRAQTGTTGLSRKASELSETLVTEAYISRFNRELQKLGAEHIRVELVKTRAERGRVKHSVRLREVMTPGARISEVLSEGERRIISLAAFLADVTGRSARSPFIFDDPISSLDSTWEERTIDRLIELSQSRQVIIFTHRLSLLGMICDKMPDDEVHTVHIRRESWGTGQPGQVPLFGKHPDKALSNLKNDRLARARKALLADGHEAYFPLAKAICSDVRILTERMVEVVFLADVVQRHRRAVNTKGKIHKLAKINSDDCGLVDEIMTKYSRYEHSQSAEAPIELPGPDELAADIDRLLLWHEEFKNRPIYTMNHRNHLCPNP